MNGEQDDSEPSTPTLKGAATRGTDRGAASETPPEAEASGVIVASQSGPRAYQLMGLIGRGGMGDVHLARDARVGRAVALKVLRHDQETQERLAARFFREARVQGRLEHPSVVPVYDMDVDGEGRAFFVMKKVAGDTLDAVVRGLRLGDPEMEQRYSLRRLLTAFQQICLTVDYAHSKGVIHRDIKLSNLMLGDFGEVYVLDWGVAKVQDIDEPAFDPVTGDPNSDSETRHDDVLGTVGYMPPEQILDSRSVDATADVYALGVVLFALLTRQSLHGRGSPMQVAEATRRGTDARASLRAPELDIPPELDAICVRATAQRPEERYPSARALHDAIGRFLDGDRDTRLRAELASRHLEAARHEIARMDAEGEPDAEARRRALRQAGRALALSPESAEATELLTGLMFTPPDRLPPEVESETRELSQLERLRTGSVGMWAILGFAVTLGLVLWVGVTTWKPLALIYVPLALAMGVLATVRHYDEEFSGPIATVVGLLVCVAIGASSRIIGPLWLPPLFALAYTAIVTATHGLGKWRIGGVVLALLSILVPWGLEAAGVLSPLYVFGDGSVQVVSDVVRLDDPRALTALGVASVGTILLVAAVMWNFSAGDMKSRRELQMLAWHFRQVASHGEARGASERPPPPPVADGAAGDAALLPDGPTDDPDAETRPSRRLS